MAMCTFDKHIALLLLCIIAMVNTERWYSATIIERREAFSNASNIDNHRTNYVQDSEHRFLPIVMTHPKETKNKRHDFEPTMDTFSTLQNNRSTSLIESDAIVIHYNTTTDSENILRKSQPIRKNIRKRCPAVKPRQSKQLRSKQLPKTKFLEVFQVVEFEHVPCISSSGLEGTCLPEYECNNGVGSMMGTCADGYGTCCVSQFLCDDRSATQTGWFTNPDFPSPSTDRLSCVFALDKSSEDVTQIRLDFVIFELLPPTDGVCQEDQFIISGQNVNSIIPILCGINTGQHIYVEVGDVEGPIYLTFQTASSESRLYSIKVTQLTSSDELTAPSGCLQYFKESQGYLESFNYRDKSDIVIAKRSSYLNNLNYAMCIERTPETCSVTYTNAGNMQILNYDIDGLPIIPPGQAGVEILNCPSDWLLIAATRLCGDRLNDGSVFQDFNVNAPITDNSAGPIVVWFRSDESYVGYGFKLLFQQNSCSS